MEEMFFKSGWDGIIALSLSFVFIQLWKYYAQRRDYKVGETTRKELITLNYEQNNLIKDLISEIKINTEILRSHDARAIETQRRIIEMSAEGGTIDKLLDLISANTQRRPQ